MSYSVSGTMITLTRGDTFSALITITDLNDNQYIPMNGDRIRFAMKNDYNDETPLLIKEIPSTAKQTILPDTEYNCLSQVEVEAIPYVEADNPAGGVTVTIAG